MANVIKKTAALYVRVSTEEQEAENQIRQLKSFCEKQGFVIFEIFEDIISGKETTRPQYDKMYECAHRRLFDILVFWDISRFSRSGTLFTLQKLKELENLGIEWHSYQDKYFSSLGEFKDVIISIMATLAKIERQKISERTKAGLQRAKEQGKSLGRKPLPNNVICLIKKYLKEGLTYSEISQKVTYKTKYGKVHHVSKGQISKIKNNRL